ncbi:hypothetical protein PVAP13_1NG557101, partial [Panicum virgatum]
TNSQAIDHETRGKIATPRRSLISHLILCHAIGAHGNLGHQSPRATSAVPSLYKNPSLHGKPNFQQAARPNSTSIHPYPKRGQIQSDNRLNPASFAECSIWCRLQSWAHIQIQHLLVPG